jgi:hypothetical protein
MKIIQFAGGALLAAIAAPVCAQATADDVRCLMLSNAFAQGATEDGARQAAARTLLFYLGRIDAHADPQAVKKAMETGKIDPKTAPADMSACAARFQKAAEAIQALGKPAQPGK